MEDKSFFKIEVTGVPFDYNSVERFTRVIQRIVVKIDKDVRVAEVNFARLYYKIEWKGLPGDLYYLTMAQKKIISEAGKYLDNWTYRINLNIIDKGEGL